MAFELVVFDVAGTTVADDGAVARALAETVAARGPAPSDAALTRVMGLAKPEALAALLADALGRDATRAEVSAANEDLERRLVRRYMLDPAVRAMPGAQAVFKELRASGVKVALDTGFSRRILDTVLLRLGWLEGVIDTSIASDEVAHGRPHPDMIHRAMRVLGVADARRVCKVGDTRADVGEGRAAGCGVVVGVASGTCSRDELEDADIVLESVADLARILRRSRAA